MNPEQEREAAKAAYYADDEIHHYCDRTQDAYIAGWLAARRARGEAKPVAWRLVWDDGTVTFAIGPRKVYERGKGNPIECVPLYAHPAPVEPERQTTRDADDAMLDALFSEAPLLGHVVLIANALWNTRVEGDKRAWTDTERDEYDDRAEALLKEMRRLWTEPAKQRPVARPVTMGERILALVNGKVVRGTVTHVFDGTLGGGWQFMEPDVRIIGRVAHGGGWSSPITEGAWLPDTDPEALEEPAATERPRWVKLREPDFAEPLVREVKGWTRDGRPQVEQHEADVSVRVYSWEPAPEPVGVGEKREITGWRVVWANGWVWHSTKEAADRVALAHPSSRVEPIYKDTDEEQKASTDTLDKPTREFLDAVATWIRRDTLGLLAVKGAADAYLNREARKS